MDWQIKLSETALKQLKKIDKNTAKRIIDFLRERIEAIDNPHSIGKALTGPLGDFWRYRVGDYPIICDIQDNNLCVLVLKIVNRREAYRR
ncbi:MAG: type II toxin-antitoxin system RelE family toxin [bacterium]